jgi:hypothetical protein
MTQPGISAPDESRTVPSMVPNVDWPSDLAAPNNKQAPTETMSKVREKDKLVMFLPVNAGATAMMVRRIARPMPHAVHPTRIELKTF